LEGLQAVLIGLHLAPPFFWGLNGVGVLAAIAWGIFMAVESVAMGWRAHQHGIVASFLIGTIFANVWCVPTYYFGRMAFLREGWMIGPVKIAAIILFAYAVTGIWVLWRGFNEPNIVKRPFFVSRFHASRNWNFLVGVALLWLPATFAAAMLPGTRLSDLKRETSYWIFFLVLIGLGFLFLRF
jgi:hypothetical protein